MMASARARAPELPISLASKSNPFQRGVCLVILETMVTTDGADIHTASTHVTLTGSNVVQYHTPGQTCDNDDNLHNTLPCEHMQCRAMLLFYKSSHDKQCTARP